MGGFGSGRQGWHGKAEHCRSLDVNKLRRDGALNPGYWGGRQWSRDGEVVASIGLRASEGALHLKYRVTPLDGKPQSIDYAVPLTWSACTKGGRRPYFVCPGSRNGRQCAQRVAKLYLKGHYFLCRHCHQLAYQSQSEDRRDRLLRRRNKLSDRLSPAGGGDVFPPRPKRMWCKTYERRLDEIWRLEEAIDAELAAWMGRRFSDLNLDSFL